MRNVNRPASPVVLSSNSKKWTKELLDAIKETDAKNKKLKKGQKKHKVSSTIWNRYNNVEVKKFLKRMYGGRHGGLCCYCEQRVGHVSHEHIEHRKPKIDFPDLAFDWDNLHLACPVCNMAKGDDWDDTYPILDAVVDKDVNKIHLTYSVTRLSVRRKPLSDRGGTTVNHANLDRPELADLASNGTRPQVMMEVFETISEIREKEVANADSPLVVTAKNALKQQFDGEHGSLVEFFARKMLPNI